MPKTKPITQTKKSIAYYSAIGRRKKAICRIRLYITKRKETKLNGKPLKKGDFVVNNKFIQNYFPGLIYQTLYFEPYQLTESTKRFIVLAKITGGGKKGQLGAFRLASARALEKVDSSFRAILKPKELLRVDARVKERRKAGLAGKARKKRQSPKR